MRSSTIAIVLCTGLVAGGCSNDGTFTAPTPVETPRIIPAEVWDLTTTLTGISGPECLTGDQEPGSSTDWLLQMRREGGTILLSYGPVHDELVLRGSTNDKAFIANALAQGGFPCDDASVNSYQFEAQVAGTFSSDGSKLTAKETWTYRFETLEPLVMSFDWTATRR